jgi:hypothetical protein
MRKTEEWRLLGGYAVWLFIPEDAILHSHPRENFKSYINKESSQGLRFSQRRLRTLSYSRIYICVVRMPTDVSEENITSIYRVANQPRKKPACSTWPWRWRWYIPSKCRLTYGLHCAISRKMATFKETAVYGCRTVKRTCIICLRTVVSCHAPTFVSRNIVRLYEWVSDVLRWQWPRSERKLNGNIPLR